MSMEKRRDELGKLLACLLVSRKGVSTIRDLERDYRENEGRNIPYREFGSLNSLDFFRSISNHIRLAPGNGTYLVYPVVSDKVKHVNDLVSRQRPARRNTPVRRRSSRYSHCFPPVPEPKPFIPNTVQKDIAKILTSSRSGVDKSYIAQCLDKSEEVAGTVDSNNVDDYLTGMPYTAVAKGNRVYPSRALSATPNTPRRTMEDIDGFEIVSPGDSFTRNEVSPRNKNNNKIQVVNEYPAGAEDEDYCYVEDEFAQPHSLNMNNNYAEDKEYQYQQSAKTGNDNRLRMSSAEFIHRAGSQYNQSQYNGFANEINNVEENCEDDAESERRGEEEANGVTNADCTFESDDDGSIDIINPRIKSRLKQLIEKYPDGIWCANLLCTYLEEYKVPLDYADLGFGSVSQLASNLPKIFRLHRRNTRGDFMLYDATKPLPPSADKPESEAPSNAWENEYYDDDDVDPFPMALPLETTRSLIPSDVMTHGESVGQQRIPDISPGEECLEIYVVDVFTPSLFWIHLRKKRSKLSQLMEAMHDFYEREGDNYCIPPVVLEKGLNCVCTFEDKWHRAIIKTVKPDGNATLIFYDYGTTKTYPPKDLRFLVRTFSHLTAQAIPCGLYNVKPVNADAWTRGVSDEFYTKVADLPLVAMVVKVDRENNSMLVSLVDTQYENDVHINDWLVDNGYAESGFMVRSRPSNFVIRHYLACLNYYYNMGVRTPRSAEREKVDLQVNYKGVDRSESESASGSKIELKSANFIKDFMARHSKYKKENSNTVSSKTETRLVDRQANSTPVVNVVSARVKDCSSTDLNASKVDNPYLGKIGNELLSKRLSCRVKSTNNEHNDDKNNEKIAEAQYLRTCKQSRDLNLKQNDNSSSTTSQSEEYFSAPSDNSDLGKTSRSRIQGPVKYEDAGKLEFSGTFRSFYGGHGEMKPIDWSKVRSEMRVEGQTESLKPKAKSQAIVESPAWKLYEDDTKKSGADQRTDKCSDDLSRESLNPRLVSDFEKVTVEKKMEKKKILPAKECFLNAVQSNKDHYYSLHGEKLWWSTEGNIQDKPGVITPLLRNRKKHFNETDNDLTKVSASPEILDMLKEKRLWYKEKSIAAKDVLDPELQFIMQLDKLADFVAARISDPSENKTVKNLMNEKIFPMETSTPLKENTSQSKLPSQTTQTRFATILDYMNKKKKQNVTAISEKKIPNERSNTSRDTNNFHTVASTSSSSNLSGSSNTSSRKLYLKKDSSTSYEPESHSTGDSEKNDGIFKNQKHSKIYSSVENTNSKSDSISSEELQTVRKLDESLEHLESRTRVPEIDKSVEKLHSTMNTTNLENISAVIDSSDSSDFKRTKTDNHSKFSANTQSLSDLDSDDLSCSYSNSETESVQQASPKTNVDLTKIEPETEDIENTFVTSEASTSEDAKNISEPCGYVSREKSKIFAPLVDDSALVDSGDIWEELGRELEDFMKEDLRARIVGQLQHEDEASQSAEITEVLDNSDLDHDFVEDYPELENTAEPITEGIEEEKYSKRYDTSDDENRGSTDSTKRSEFVLKEIENSSGDSDQPGCSSIRNESWNNKKENKPAAKIANSIGDQDLSKRNKTVIGKTDDVGSNIRISMQDYDRAAEVTNYEKTLGTPVTMSKTKSMHEMLNNFKSKRTLSRVTHDLITFDDGLHSGTKSSATLEPKTSTSTKNAKDFFKSEMLLDSDDASSGSNCSITFIANNSVSRNGKKPNFLLEERNLFSEESQTSSSDAIEFIEEQSKEPCTQFPILSRIKKEHLSVKSSVEDLGVQNANELDISTVSERDSSVLNESSESNNCSSRSLLEKIRLMYSNKS